MQANVTINNGEWTRLTDAPVEAITVQNIGRGIVVISGGQQTPNDTSGLRLKAGEALSSGTPLTEIFPDKGISMHVYARSINLNGWVFYNYA